MLDRSHSETSHGWPEFLPGGRHFLYVTLGPGRPSNTQYGWVRLG